MPFPSAHRRAHLRDDGVAQRARRPPLQHLRHHRLTAQHLELDRLRQQAGSSSAFRSDFARLRSACEPKYCFRPRFPGTGLAYGCAAPRAAPTCRPTAAAGPPHERPARGGARRTAGAATLARRQIAAARPLACSPQRTPAHRARPSLPQGGAPPRRPPAGAARHRRPATAPAPTRRRAAPRHGRQPSPPRRHAAPRRRAAASARAHTGRCPELRNREFAPAPAAPRADAKTARHPRVSLRLGAGTARPHLRRTGGPSGPRAADAPYSRRAPPGTVRRPSAPGCPSSPQEVDSQSARHSRRAPPDKSGGLAELASLLLSSADRLGRPRL